MPSTAAGDGSIPTAGLILDDAGNLYGTTTMAARFTALFLPSRRTASKQCFNSFTGGSAMVRSLLESSYRDTAGNLFGVTEFGGAGSAPVTVRGVGRFSKLRAQRLREHLHSFSGRKRRRQIRWPACSEIRWQSVWYDLDGRRNRLRGQSRLRHRVQLAPDGVETLLHVFRKWKKRLSPVRWPGRRFKWQSLRTTVGSRGTEAVMAKCSKSHRNSSGFQAP